MQNILFSIIIPLFNRENFIKETLLSVLNQTEKDYECIIVDDGSTDESVNYVRSVIEGKNKFSLYQKNNEGVSSARNFGLKKAKGQYVCFLDSDDLWNSDYLKNLRKLIYANPKINMICGAWSVFINDLKNIIEVYDYSCFSKNEYFISDFFEVSLNLWRTAGLTSAICVRKSVFSTIEFNTRYSMGEDVDVWVRIAAKHPDTLFYNSPKMFYRTSQSDSLTSTVYDLLHSVPFEDWYSLKSSSKYLNNMTTLMIYSFARNLYKLGRYKDSESLLLRAKGNYLFCRRLISFFSSVFKAVII
jgi:glycosyltransferase involved in cell wall biosynthesis